MSELLMHKHHQSLSRLDRRAAAALRRFTAQPDTLFTRFAALGGYRSPRNAADSISKDNARARPG